MQSEQSIAIMKALADGSRLAIVNSLLENPQCVEEIARRHALAPSTVSFHLRKLVHAGLVSSRKEQYYTVFRVNEAIFDITLRQIVSAPQSGKAVQDRRMREYQRKVLEAFFAHGRLTRLPAQQKKRLIVLQQFARRFEPRRRYVEQEVTGLIMPLFDDYCTIRRLLVDEGLILREGTQYWREQADDAPEVPMSLPVPGGKETQNMQEKARRAEIKRAASQNAPPIGVFQIRNRQNGRIYVAASRNLEGERNSRLFQLRMGRIVFSRELQEDLKHYGAENFEFSVLAVLDRPDPEEPAEQALAALELQWLEKLQPFGERGYNSERGYQRSLERLKNRNGNLSA